VNGDLYLSRLEFEVGHQFEPIIKTRDTLLRDPKRAQSQIVAYPKLEGALVVIKQDLAIVSSLRQMELEDVLASQSNMTPEILPAVDANYKGLPQSLVDKSRHQADNSIGRP